MIISVFGSASPTPEQKLYQDALELGRLLGQAGFDVMTGGYCGTMEAVSRGASEAGVNVIGVACRQIEDYRPVGPNAWVRTLHSTDTLSERIEYLTTHADAYLALPGGIGTLAEIAMVFNKMVINAIPTQTLILIGEGWKKTIESFIDGQADNVNERTRTLPQYAKDPQEAVKLLIKSLEEKQNG